MGKELLTRKNGFDPKKRRETMLNPKEQVHVRRKKEVF